jgi:hypothetical protein
MNWLLRVVIHNLVFQAGVAGVLVILATCLMRVRVSLTWLKILAVGALTAIALTAAVTGLSWHFRSEYPGNYPLVLHLISAALPAMAGSLVGCLAVIAGLRAFPAAPPN